MGWYFFLIYRPKREKSQWDGIFFFITSSELLTHTVPIAKISFGTVSDFNLRSL